MHSDPNDPSVNIPAVFVSFRTGMELSNAIKKNEQEVHQQPNNMPHSSVRISLNGTGEGTMKNTYLSSISYD